MVGLFQSAAFHAEEYWAAHRAGRHFRVMLTGWMSWRVRVGAQPGAIVILHEGDPSRKRVVKVLNAVLPNLRRRGYQVVTASHLLRAAA